MKRHRPASSSDALVNTSLTLKHVSQTDEALPKAASSSPDELRPYCCSSSKWIGCVFVCCCCVSVSHEDWCILGGRREHVFQSTALSSPVLLTCCFMEVVSFPRQAYVPSLCAENRLHCGSAQGLDYGGDQFEHRHVWNHVQFTRSIREDQSLAAFISEKDV